MAYLMARPALASVERDSGEVRRFFEAYLERQNEKGGLKPYEPVVVAAALAFNDAQRAGGLEESTREALDTMWTTQREDGGWDWPKCGWAPMEVDDHFGVTLAALAVGVAPGNYQETEEARGGLERMRDFLRRHESPSLHHRIMVAWASLRVQGLMEELARRQVLDDVLSKQLADGGWSTPGLLVDWKEYQRKDGKPHTPEVADAYGTGLALIFSREMGIPPGDPRLRAAIAWLKRHQRASGKWFTRSPAEDSKHYISNTGTAYAVLALQACGELPGWPFGKGKEGRAR
jgi:squalene-hopene/tetraprenyl-beta-curcumene cyclase